MHKFLALAVVACLAAGCASTPPAQVAQAEKTKDTGTMLPVANHGRMLKYIGNQSYREDAAQIKSLGNEVGMRGN